MLCKIVVVVSVFAFVCGSVVRRQDSCPLFCPEIYQPLCGSDGKTYSNECYFHRAQCMDSTLTLTYKGPCGDIINVRWIICTTPMCRPVYEPVCGSDGVTYENECTLNNAKCMNEDLKLQHTGTCTGASEEETV